MVIGGVLADLVSWRAGFFINLPIGAVMIVLATRYLVEQPRRRGTFDVIGAICSTVGIGAIIFGIITSAEVGWGSPVTIASLAVGAVLLVLLVVNEARAAQPVMPLRLFASRHRSGAYAIRFLFLGAMMGFFYFTTQFLQDALGWNPLQAGLGFLPMTVVNFAVAMSVTRLSRRMPPILMLTLGLLITALGMAWLSQVTIDSSYALGVGLPMLLIGLGQGLTFAPLTGYGIAGVTGEDAGAASGLLNTSHQLGSSVGLALLVAVGVGAAASTSEAAAVVARVNSALVGATGLLILALVVAILVILPAEVRRRREA